MTTAQELRARLDLWVAARLAGEAIAAVMEIEERSGYAVALRQLFSAELDAAEDLARLGFDVQLRNNEDPPPGQGLIDTGA